MILETYWRGDRSIASRAAYADYCRAQYRRLCQGERKDCVPSDFAKAHIERGAKPNVGRATLWRIKAGKKIRVETERRVLRA